jgi:hypothetical protein
MRTFFAILSLSFVAAGPVGDLYQPSYCLDHEFRAPSKHYEPQPGDLIFFTMDDSVFWDVCYKIAWAGHPYHIGVVVRMPDGTLASLESGPDDSDKVEVMALYERLKFHHCHRGRVWIRQRKTPLTEEQSCRLTQFAIQERGKRYALWRMMAQVTPLRLRAPVRTHFTAKTLGPHGSYMCAECIVEALVFAGVLDGESMRPRATYPIDMFFDRSNNHYLNKNLNLSCGWEPPARWSTDGCENCKAWKGSFHNPNPAGIPVHPYFWR